MARQGKSATILDRVQVDGNGEAFNVAPYRHILVQIATSDSAEGLLKCLGSGSMDEPDWDISPSEINIFAPKRMIDLDSNSGVAGTTGIPLSGTDLILEFKVNTDNLNWLNFNLSNYAAGFFTVKVYATDDSRNSG